MKLLIITQIVDVNDDLLGFFHSWIKEFSKRCEQVVVICLKKGEYDLPDNVRVLSLGKENGGSKIKYLWRFFRYIFAERKNYDAVFVHMNKEYILLGGLYWRLMRKKIVFWYAHFKTDWLLRLAVIFTDKVVTSVALACRLKTKKLIIVGQGIDIEKFKSQGKAVSNGKINIICLSRISPVKKSKF